MNPQNEYVFTETKKGQVEGIVGQVLHEATLGPVNDDDYKRIMQMRTKAAGISLRTVEVIGEAAGRKINILNSKDNGGKGFSQGFVRRRGPHPFYI